MAGAVLTVSDETKGELTRFSWINWSEVAREEAVEKAEREERFKRIDKLLKGSKMTDELASRLADELKGKVAKKHGV
jgi:hypothetical protein